MARNDDDPHPDPYTSTPVSRSRPAPRFFISKQILTGLRSSSRIVIVTERLAGWKGLTMKHPITIGTIRTRFGSCIPRLGKRDKGDLAQIAAAHRRNLARYSPHPGSLRAALQYLRWLRAVGPLPPTPGPRARCSLRKSIEAIEAIERITR